MIKWLWRLVCMCLAALVFMLTLFGCQSENIEPIETDDYLIIYSDMLSSKGGYYYINESGVSVRKNKTLKMQDLSHFSVTNSRIVLSGERKNNTIVFNRGSAVFDTDFVFLNNPKYNGVTAISSNERSILGMMNGGFSEGIYKTLFVKQSLTEDNEIHQYTFNSYGHSILELDDSVLCAGTHMLNSGEFHAEIVEYNYSDTFYHEYTEYEGFWQILNYGYNYVCLAEDGNASKNTLVSINPETFLIQKEVNISDSIGALFFYSDNLYAIGNRGLYIIDFNTSQYSLVVDLSRNSENGEILYFAYLLDDNIFAFYRKSDREKSLNNQCYYGVINRINLETLSVQETPVTNDVKYRMDSIFVVPYYFIME